jgi:hypothetical protein
LLRNKKCHVGVPPTAKILGMARDGPYAVKNSVKRYFLLLRNKKCHVGVPPTAKVLGMARDGPYAVKNSVKRYFSNLSTQEGLVILRRIDIGQHPGVSMFCADWNAADTEWGKRILQPVITG